MQRTIESEARPSLPDTPPFLRFLWALLAVFSGLCLLIALFLLTLALHAGPDGTVGFFGLRWSAPADALLLISEKQYAGETVQKLLLTLPGAAGFLRQAGSWALCFSAPAAFLFLGSLSAEIYRAVFTRTCLELQRPLRLEQCFFREFDTVETATEEAHDDGERALNADAQ